MYFTFRHPINQNLILCHADKCNYFSPKWLENVLKDSYCIVCHFSIDMKYFIYHALMSQISNVPNSFSIIYLIPHIDLLTPYPVLQNSNYTLIIFKFSAWKIHLLMFLKVSLANIICLLYVNFTIRF